MKLNKKKDVDDIIITNIEESQRLQLIKNYYLIYRRFAYFESKIFIKLYEIIIYFSILRFKYKKTCLIYFIKKMKKKINHMITLRKNEILNFVFINIYELLSKNLVENITFLKIIVTSVLYILSRVTFSIRLFILNIIRLSLTCLDKDIYFYINVFFLCTYFLFT